MKSIVLGILGCLVFCSCKQEKAIELNFLDEFVLADSIAFQNSIIGGLSGIDYANDAYYFVVDDAKNPRFLKAAINIEQNKIKAVDFKKVVLLNDTTTSYYKENALDLESIFVEAETEEVYFVGEGSINIGKSPTVFKTGLNGNFIEAYELPKNLSDIKNIKHNAVFEGSSKSIDGKGFWVAMEGPLKTDGEDPTFTKASSPIRITYFDKTSKKATKQFAYQLEHITKPSKGNINLNGLTSILEYKENHFFIIERTYQSGYGSYGNIVRIFDAVIDKKTTNVLNIDALKESGFIPLEKRLLLNFEEVKGQLTEGIIDNIEGITLGPKLANGNQSLLLVADDNFQVYGKQLNQFILLEITD
ncbi:esterase-like activity of phytase family protein [Polaribacter sp. AHE13PA]|uniref:esterase-like activity of phytase family protein n=1 Tax=Polaribacter sp. AHE13PA TaxID=2745562 RepID=UPI001C4E7C94|nr:esterase-like activity of phytase family protein [Polaribacter sp. AHE13PA]QXP67262.1 esterase-like activity of phytase family protein [Polaribacter sp. AHE13PA]